VLLSRRYVSEIAEGSRILQDQLALMDERYLELRNRLESSRKQFMTQMARVTKESSELRVKYSLATHGKLLDTLPLPSQYELSLINGAEAFRGSMDTAELLHRSGTGKGGKPRAKSARAALSSSSRHARPASPGSPGGQELNRNASGLSWNDHTLGQEQGTTPYRDHAQQMFVNGITHNQRFAVPTLSTTEIEAKEKHIVKKINSKYIKGDPARWTEDKLQELVKGTG
jgi:hypothetical protein